MFVCMHSCEQKFETVKVRSKNLIKSILNVRLCSEAASYWCAEIQVRRISEDFLNYFPLGFIGVTLLKNNGTG